MEATMHDPQAWVWQRFHGPMPAAQAAIAAVFADPRVGARIPLPDNDAPPAPQPVGPSGAIGMFAVMTRRGAPVPTPPGLDQDDIDPAMIEQVEA
jgi:hypothetical protein